MPSDPDNKMDELLKSYAKKRQDEAGAPGEIHPATRRLLQAEIAKLRPEPSKPSEWWVPWWQSLLKVYGKLAFAVGLLIVLAIGLRTVMDSAKQAAFESQLAKNESAAEKTLSLAADRDSLRDE